MHEVRDVFDRRAVTRIYASLFIEIRYQTANRELVVCRGQAINLSEDGLSVQTSENLPSETDLVLMLRFSKSREIFHATGRLMVKQEQLGDGKNHYGIEIQHMPPDSRRMLSAWLSDRMLSTKVLKDRRFDRSVRSELVNFKNARGANLIGFVDSALGTDTARAPFIILAPGFGETKTNSLSLSYILVKNGFRVLRYDATDHTGESDGSIVNCTLSKLKDDLSASIDFVERTYGCPSVGLILSSLSALMGLRVAAEDPRVVFVGGLVPVVNLRHTLSAVYSEDLVGGYTLGKRWGLIDMLGYPIASDRFLADAVNEQFHTLEATKRTLSKIKAPTWFFVGSKDPWVLEEDVKAVLGSCEDGQKGYTVIESSMHQLQENPLASRDAMEKITKVAIRFMQGQPENESKVIFPRLREVAIQSRIEKERRKLSSNLTKEEDVQFWTGYLDRFQSIIRIPDFREYFGTIQRLLGDPQDHQLVLDAGCGNGGYGLWLLQDHIQEIEPRAKNVTSFAYTYVGLDFVATALDEAKQVHEKALTQWTEGQRVRSNPPTFTYVLSDLDENLPFLDNYFDKIVCSLVLSYVRHPQKTLRELYRTLAPGGNLVITTLKPFADLSVIYRRFLGQAQTPEDIAEARKLLTNAGLICSRESEGHFKFFGETELIGMMTELKASPPVLLRSFADQANVAAVTKIK